MEKIALLFLAFSLFGCHFGITEPKDKDVITDEKFSFISEDLLYKEQEKVSALKGFVCWPGTSKDKLCSLEYLMVNFDSVCVDENILDWSSFEESLNDIKNKNRQAVVRFVIDNVDSRLNLTEYILKKIKLYSFVYEDGNTYTSPDYNDEYLLSQIINLIKEFGKRYDGDSRIAFIQTGFLGHWGEQHTYYVQENGSISNNTFSTFFRAFDKAFNITPIGSRCPHFSGLKEADIGLYNDMITSDDDDDYFSELLALETSNPDSWKNSAITGEIAPGLQEKLNKTLKSKKSIYNKYISRIKEFHITCALNAELYENENYNPTEYIKASNKMGYDFYISDVKAKGDKEIINFTIDIENKGVAPFYYSWPVEIALIDEQGSFYSTKLDWDVTEIMSGDKKTFTFSEDCSNFKDNCKMLLRIINPMDGGYPFLFSNVTQDNDVEGFVTLGQIKISRE